MHKHGRYICVDTHQTENKCTSSHHTPSSRSSQLPPENCELHRQKSPGAPCAEAAAERQGGAWQRNTTPTIKHCDPTCSKASKRPLGVRDELSFFTWYFWRLSFLFHCVFGFLLLTEGFRGGFCLWAARDKPAHRNLDYRRIFNQPCRH